MKDGFLALDTEDDSNGMVNIINFFDGQRHTTWVRDAGEAVDAFRLKAWNWLYAQAPAHVWCCNTEYDLINLFGLWLGKMATLQYVSSGLLRASLRDRNITFFDTLRHWPMSVEQMGGFLGMSKVWGPGDDRFSVEHCRADTEIVWYFVAAMLQRYDELGLTVKATLPSMALQLFTKKFYRRPFTRLPQPLVERLRGGYYGGRVEVYRFGYVPGPIKHYDVNSLFPSVMVNGVFPDLSRYQLTSSPDWQREGMAELTMSVPRSEYPPLPMRGVADMVYAYGTLRGMWCYPEVRQALADGAVIEAVHMAVEFNPMETPFRDYIHFCYGQRRQAKHALDDVLWKLYMNSLYGKFGQRPGLEMIYDDKAMKLQTDPSPAANVIWAAYVTCLARLKLLAFLRQCSACYYTDTDSLFTPDEMATSKELGDLKLEGVYAGMEAKGNKMYAIDMTADDVAKLPEKERIKFHEGDRPGVFTRYKAKGVQRAEIKDGVLVADAARDFIRTGRAVFRKPIRFRESRRLLMQPNVWVEMEKKREAVYTKRIIHEDGTTEPWEWMEYQREMEEQ